MRKLLETIGTGIMILLLMICLLLGMGSAGHAETQRMYVKVRVDSSLTLRAEPKPDGEVLGSLERGNAVNVPCEDGDWRQVERDGVTGWVHADYLSDIFPPLPYGGAYRVAAKPTLNVRDAPKGTVIARLKANATVYVYDRCIDEDGAEWALLDEGWVMSEYIMEVPDDG